MKKKTFTKKSWELERVKAKELALSVAKICFSVATLLSSFTLFLADSLMLEKYNPWKCGGAFVFCSLMLHVCISPLLCFTAGFSLLATKHQKKQEMEGFTRKIKRNGYLGHDKKLRERRRERQKDAKYIFLDKHT